MKKSLFFCVFLYGIGVMSCSNELEVQEEVKALPTVRELVAYPKSDAGRSRSGQLNWEEWEKVHYLQEIMLIRHGIQLSLQLRFLMT